jgi:hypothetical protein
VKQLFCGGARVPGATLISRGYFPNWCQIGPFRFNRLRRFSQLTQPPCPGGPARIAAPRSERGGVAVQILPLRPAFSTQEQLGGPDMGNETAFATSTHSPDNLQATNLGAGGSNPSGRAKQIKDLQWGWPFRAGCRVTLRVTAARLSNQRPSPRATLGVLNRLSARMVGRPTRMI